MQPFNSRGILASADSTLNPASVAAHGSRSTIPMSPETDALDIDVPRSTSSRSYDIYNRDLQALPLEIIENIVDNVTSSRDIKACALLCRYIRYRCQSKLFRHLTINCDSNPRAFKEGGLVYTIAQDTTSSIINLIKSLNITNRYGYREILREGEIVHFLLGKFVSRLNAVENLEIYGGGMEWNQAEFLEGMMEVLKLPSLKELKLSNLEGFPMPLILWGHHLTRVEVERVMFRQTVFVGFRKSPVVPSLREFKMDNNMMGLTLLALHFLSDNIVRSTFSGLRKLVLEFRDREHDELSKMDSLLTTCQGSLEHLSLFLTHEAYVQTQLYANNIRLSRLAQLRSFTTRIFIVTRNGYLEPGHPFKLLKVLFMGGPTSLQRIRFQIFHRFGDHTDDDGPEVSGWKELDLVLASLTGLREVSMVVCCTQCTPSQIEDHKSIYDLPIVSSNGVNVDRTFTDNVNMALELED